MPVDGGNAATVLLLRLVTLVLAVLLTAPLASPASAQEVPATGSVARATEEPALNTVTAYGSARDHGPSDASPTSPPLVAVAGVPDGDGYWLVAADGGVFTFGDALFFGSEGGRDLPEPVVGMAASPDGSGYWLAARDGQVYPHGVADHGSAAEHDAAGHAPTAGIAAGGAGGYWLVHSTIRTARPTQEGPHVAAIQRRLQDLGYWLGSVDGVYGETTKQAVYAFQKYQGLAVDGIVGPNTRAALDTASRPVPRGQGDLIEVDKSRQLVFVVRDGRTRWVFNTSTGTEDPYTYEGERYLADTPPGRWTISRAVDGWRVSNLGRLYRPRYFHRDGIAIHGYPLVPPYPASHGCVRVTIAAMDFIWANDLAPIGSGVWVHGQSPTD